MGPSYRVSETGLPQSIRLSAIFKASKVDGTYMSFSMALMHECIVDELIRNHGTHGSCTVCDLFGHIQDVGNYSSRPAHAFFLGGDLENSSDASSNRNTGRGCLTGVQVWIDKPFRIKGLP